MHYLFNKKGILYSGVLFLIMLCFIPIIPNRANSSVHTPLWTHHFPRYEGTTQVTISADGQYFAAWDSTYIYMFSRNSDTPLWRRSMDWKVTSVAISADGQYIVAGNGYTEEGRIYLFTKDSSTPIWTSTIEDNFLSVDISADGQYIAAGSWNNRTYLFSRTNPTPIWNYTVELPCNSVALSADGQLLAARLGSSDYHEGAVYLFNRSSSQSLWNYSIQIPTWREIEDLAISANGEYIIAGSRNSRIYLFNKTGPTPMWSHYDDDSVFSVKISSEGQYFATIGVREVHFYNRTGPTGPTLLWNYSFNVGGITSTGLKNLVMSSDGKYVAATRSNLLVVFNDTSATPSWNFSTPDAIAGIGLSADGNYSVIISYTDDGNILYYFHSTQIGPMIFPWEFPIYLIVLIVIGVCLASQYGVYRYLDKKGLETKHKENTVFGMSFIFYGILGFFMLRDVPFYDQTSPLLIQLYSYLFLILGIVITILAVLKKLPPRTSPGDKKKVIIAWVGITIFFSVFCLVIYLIGHALYYLPYHAMFFWIFPLFYAWSYYKEKFANP